MPFVIILQLFHPFVCQCSIASVCTGMISKWYHFSVFSQFVRKDQVERLWWPRITCGRFQLFNSIYIYSIYLGLAGRRKDTEWRWLPHWVTCQHGPVAPNHEAWFSAASIGTCQILWFFFLTGSHLWSCRCLVLPRMSKQIQNLTEEVEPKASEKSSLFKGWSGLVIDERNVCLQNGLRH